MGKEHRHIRCSHCTIKLRITISEQQYGKIVLVTCPKCTGKSRVTIPTPVQKERASRPPAENSFGDLLDDLFGKPEDPLRNLFKNPKK